MATKTLDSAKNRYAYIPPSVQQSMSEHMQKTMPPHLKKYQQSGTFIPRHAEQELSQHLQKNLPGHLKQYADPYLQQHVVGPNTVRPTNTDTISSPQPTPSNSPYPSGSNFANTQPTSNPSSQSTPPNTPTGSGQYDFIMNPDKTPRGPMLSLGSTKQKILVVIVALISLIILYVVASNLLNSSANAQRDKLQQLAIAQTEILRVADEASKKISNKDLLNQATSTQMSVESSKVQVVNALSKRGKKIKDKDLKSVKIAENDKILSDGEQNGRLDETYKKLLEQQLLDYRQRLKSVHESGNKSEKEIASIADKQIDLLLGKKQASQ
ncbi:MAG TPA: hypothetical protein VD947_02395 [Patescibacteria group bacterium]|nr:hypothetical protein [Patescibacteria group bacterium]